MRRAFALLASLAFVLGIGAIAVGCTNGQPSTSSQSASIAAAQSHGETLRVGVQYGALSLPAVYAEENGYFQAEGLDVELFTFANGAEENKAMGSGEIDIASNGLASVYLLAQGSCRWIGESDAGSAALAVFAREGSAPTQVAGQLPEHPGALGSAETLRGLTVVGPAGTMEEWAAVAYFAQFGLQEGQDYQFIEMDRTQAVESVIDGSADVVVASDVAYSRMLEEAGFVALASGIEITGVPFNNGYLATSSILESRPDALVSFLRAVYRAAETLNSDLELSNAFAYEYYRMNGQPATMEDVQRESATRSFLVPEDFTSPDYRLGSGVLYVGEFDEGLGALDEQQIDAIQASIDPTFLDRAFGITVQGMT